MTCVMAVVIGITLWLHTIVTPADVMIHYAQDAVEYARKHHRIELDFSEPSVETLDFLLATIRQQNLPEEQREIHTKMWGGYFGEVIRRQHGGVWTQPAGAYTLDVKNTKIPAPLKVRERLLNSTETSLTTYYELLLKDWSR